MLDHMTACFSSLLSRNHWYSVCFIIAPLYWCRVFVLSKTRESKFEKQWLVTRYESSSMIQNKMPVSLRPI